MDNNLPLMRARRSNLRFQSGEKPVNGEWVFGDTGGLGDMFRFARMAAAAAAALSAVGLASSPAGAHGILIDTSTPTNFTSYACSNNDPSCGSLSDYLVSQGGSGDYAGVFANIYIYNDGLVTVGSPQGTGAPVELFPAYSPALSGATVYLTANNSPSGTAIYYDNIVDLRVTWVTPQSIFAVEMQGNFPDPNTGQIPQSFTFDYGYGAYSGTWANGTSTPVLGGTLPKGVTVGWSGAYAMDAFGDIASTQSYTSMVTSTDNYDASDNLNPLGEVVLGDKGLRQVTPAVSSAPEPETWALMIVGFGLIGAALRRGRLAVA